MASTRHSPGAAHNPVTVAAPSRRDRALIAGCIVLTTALAWGYLILLNRRMASTAAADSAMVAMGMVMHEAWSARDVLFTFVMWGVMMVGMMTATATPVLLLLAGAEARRPEPRASLTVPAFALGYLAVWLGFSAAAAMAQWVLHQAALLSPMLATSSPRLAGAILIAAGLYQLSPLKAGCLAHCQTPLGFLMGHWRDGTSGAFRMGLAHGSYCLGCCWALMGVLFVVGVMNLAWVAVLTMFVLAEKLGPVGVRVARAGGAILVIAGVVFALRSGAVISAAP